MTDLSLLFIYMPGLKPLFLHILAAIYLWPLGFPSYVLISLFYA